LRTLAPATCGDSNQWKRYAVLKEAIAMDAFHDGGSIRVRLVAMALLTHSALPRRDDYRHSVGHRYDPAWIEICMIRSKEASTTIYS